MTWAPQESQKSIYETLTADTTLATLLGATVSDKRIFDFVPQNQAYPYVTMAIKPMSDRGNQTLEGVEIAYQINVWHQPGTSVVSGGPTGRGDKTVQEIQNRIDQLLHRQDICIDGWNIISHRRSTVDILDEPDGVTKHGVQIFNLLLGEV